MKKIFKSISLICLAILMICPVFLAGCSKNLTVNIKVEGEGGGAYLFTQGKAETSGKPVVGDNVVKEGNNFEYFVAPDKGYKIASVIIDDKAVELKEREIYEGKLFSFVNVKENHKVEVSFELRSWEVKFICTGNSTSNPESKEFNIINVLHKNSISVNTNQYGGENNTYWYVLMEDGSKKYLVNGQDNPSKALATNWKVNSCIINDHREIYCDLSLEQLQANIEALS